MSPPTDDPRDWDKELADIDKLIAAGAGSAPAPPATGPGKARAAAPPGGGVAAFRARHAVLFTWLRLGLGLTLGAGMTQWPYTQGCGLPLYGYLAGVGAVVVAACWSTVSSWRTRSGFAHTLSVGLLLWGVTLAAREILPRVGYAKQTASWTCAAPAPAAPAAPAPAPAAPPVTP